MTRYREVGLLAEGGMAIIAQAERDDGATVVIKRVRPPFCFDQSFLRLFADEGAVHAALDHENIVRLLDKGEDDAGPYLVFEHVDGTDLAVVLGDGGTALDTECVLAVAVPLLKALAFVHESSLQVVHRDISPGNVLIATDGSVKLADFGVASFSLKTEATVAGEMKGKFAYMAPEQTRGEKVGPRADLYSAGVVLWEALAGKRLFDGPTDADVVAAVRTMAVPPLAGPLAPLVASLLEKDPDKRPATARDVVKTLQAVALELGLDEGLQRHAARLARTAPRRELQQRDDRRRTQRVLGADPAGLVVRRRRSPLLPLAAAVGVITIVGVAFAMRPEPLHERVAQLPPTPTAITRTAAPVPASPVPVATASLGALALPLATATTTSAATPKPTATTAAGPKSTTTKANPKAAPAGAIAVRNDGAPPTNPATTSVGFGKLSISTEPWAKVTVDGKLAARETPLRGFTVPAGKHTVVLENPVYHLSKTVEVDVAADSDVRKFIDLNQ